MRYFIFKNKDVLLLIEKIEINNNTNILSGKVDSVNTPPVPPPVPETPPPE